MPQQNNIMVSLQDRPFPLRSYPVKLNLSDIIFSLLRSDMELGLFTFNMLNNNFVQSESTHDSISWIPTRSNALKHLHKYSFLAHVQSAFQ